MPNLTTRFGLKKPKGGSSGSTPPEQVDIDVLNGNFDTIDSLLGAPVVTATTLPSGAVAGQTAFLGDYNSIAVNNGSWILAGARMRNQIEINDASGGGTQGPSSSSDSTSWPFTIPSVVAQGVLRVTGSFYGYLGSAAAFAGNAYLFVDGAQVGGGIRFHNHSRAGGLVFPYAWNEPMSAGSHTAFIRLTTDSGSTAFEVWDRHVQFTVEF